MPYICLILAIGAELVATTLLKYSEGFTRLLPSVFCVLSYIVCYYSFSKAVMRINLSGAYATWCGVGILATTLISFLMFRQNLSPMGIVGVFCIAVGCVLVNLG